ncbi:MAG: hypothetical protein BIFFINMI_00308 [Phycisphaerae bacterium]|nr:hypothetical protein [Phycisphaerae bacterium]
MVSLDRRVRKGPVLTRSSLPCLRHAASVNLTEGCAHQCIYCYSQGYSNFPGPGRVVLFENTPEQLAAELRRKRRPPRRVYFSPSSDPFQPPPAVQEATARSMSILLRAGVEVAFLTKGSMGPSVIEQLAQSSERVFAQVGITTTNPAMAEAFEPYAASPAQRLETIDQLIQAGIRVRPRLDPLIPGLTDTDDCFTEILCRLAERGVRSVAASYLFLRPAFARRLLEQMQSLGQSPTMRWVLQRGVNGLGSSQVLPAVERQQRFAPLRAMAAKYGISVHVCSCKNPDVAEAEACQIAGPPFAQSSSEPVGLFSQPSAPD